MKNAIASSVGLMGLIACAGSAHAVVTTRVAYMTAQQEPGAIVSNGFGCGRFVIDTDANTVTYRIVVGNLTSAETVAHIHGFADPGVNAPPVHDLPLGPIKVGVWNYAEAQEANILAGKTYVNVHTVNNGGGEVRGQIVTHIAQLDGQQETPSVVTPATGFGLFNLDRINNQLSYYIVFSGLGSPETVRHIHGPQVHTVASGTVHDLPAGSPKIGVWNYPESAEQGIIDGMYYVNVHSVNNGPGEIRGQIVSSVNPIDALQEVGPNASTAIGCGLCSIDRGATASPTTSAAPTSARVRPSPTSTGSPPSAPTRASR